MKRLVYLLVATALFAACVPFTETQVSAVTAVPSIAVTVTHASLSREQPTNTSVAPTAALPPMEVVPVSASPLTLTEFNAGTEMKRLNVIGTGTPHDIEFSPDGKLFAVATERGIYLYDGITFEQTGFIDVNDSVSAIAFSPEGDALAVAVNGKASLWNVASGRKLLDFDEGMINIVKLAYGRGGYVAAMGGDCRGCGSPVQAMILWDTKDGNQIFSQHEIWYWSLALAFTADGKHLFFGGKGGLTAIETETGKEQTVYQTEGQLISASVDAPFDLMINGDNTQLFITSPETSSEVLEIGTQIRTPFELCDDYLTDNGKYGACAKEQKMLIFDLKNAQELQNVDIDVDASALSGLFALSPNCDFLAYYGRTGIYIIELRTGRKATTLRLTDFRAARAGIIEIDGIERYALATLTSSGQVEIYDIQTGALIRTLQVNCCAISGFDFAPDKRMFATVDTDNLQIWDLQTGVILDKRNLKKDFSGSITFSPDGSSVFLTHNLGDYIVELNLQSGQITELGRPMFANSYIGPFASGNYHFNQLGNFVTFDYEENMGRYEPSFKDVKTGEVIILPIDIQSDYDFVEAFSLSPDGQYLAFGTPTDIFVWNTEILTLQSKLTGHEGRGGDGWFGKIRALIFNPQSNLLVSVGWDGTTRLWNARFGNEIRRLNICCSADFTPDGRYLITFGDGVALVWGIPQ